MSEELKYLYWLNSIEGIGFKSIAILKKYVGKAADVYKLTENELSWFLNKRQISKLLLSREVWDVDCEFAKLTQMRISFFPYGYKGYPAKLLNLPDPPAAIYVKGRLPSSGRTSVAVIGTRKCSGYGSAMAKQLGVALAQRGIQVVSGMARGVDGIGQRAVCEAGGLTFAVLGCGVDIVYPPENQRLYEKIIMQGGVISEYFPGTKPNAGQFPARNRIISGLSDAVVVVEAKEKSGTMITVDMALEQGREVYAVPGRLVDGLSSGCNRLLKQGANIVVSVEEFGDEMLALAKQKLISEMNDLKKKTPPPPRLEEHGSLKEGDESSKLALTKEEKQVFACLDFTPRSSLQISALCPEIPYECLLKMLVLFCLKGIASQMGAGSYCRTL